MSEEYYEKIRALIASVQRVNVDTVSLDSSLEQLGMDSLDGVNLVFMLEDEFKVSIPEQYLQSSRTIREIADRVAGLRPQLRTA
jgi:acyl carrier protein